MNTAVLAEPTIQRIQVSDEMITAHLADGRIISVPLAWSWRLSEATAAQRAHWELIADGRGVHWPDVDEDISAEGMLSGVPAHRPRRMNRSKTRSASKVSQSARRSGRVKTGKLGRATRD